MSGFGFAGKLSPGNLFVLARHQKKQQLSFSGKGRNAVIKKQGILPVCLCLLSSLCWPDTLKLKNGSTIIGSYAGGSETQVSFRVGSIVQQFNVSDVASLTFDSPTVSRFTDDSGSVTPTNPTPQSYSNSLTVPAGTRLMVRTIDAIDSDKNHVGDKFLATLEQALYVNNALVAPRGSDVYGRLEEVKVAGHIAGKSDLKLALTGIVINGQTVALSTGDYELSGKSRGANTAKKVGGGTAAGAVIGAIVGGGKGAAVGAGVGAGAGTAVQVMTRGEQVHVPSETLLEFSLDQSVRVPISQAR
jgi:hypothetical protein